MAETTANLGLSLVRAGAGAENLANASFQQLDALVGGAVEDRDLSAPTTPTHGQRYIVKATGTGVWTGKDGLIAHYINGSWYFYTPPVGLTMWVKDEKILVRWDGTSWKTLVGDASISLRRITSDINLANAASWTSIQWNSEDQKHDGVFGHDTAVNPDQITLKEAGTYMVWSNLTCAASSAAVNTVATRLNLGGSAVTGSLAAGTVHSAANPKETISGCQIIVAAANDVLLLEAQRESGSSTCSALLNYSRLVIRRVAGA